MSSAEQLGLTLTTVVACDVRWDAPRFVVVTRDGRRFEGCAIHGSGGVASELASVERRLRGKGRDDRDYIDVYTLLTAADETRVRIPLHLVTSVEACS